MQKTDDDIYYYNNYTQLKIEIINNTSMQYI